MANKTQPTGADVQAFLDTVDDPVRRADADRLVEIMRDATGEHETMWGASIVGFGSYHYRYASGHEGDAPAIGFSPRRSAHSVYLVGQHGERAEMFERLGRHKLGKGCLYVKRVADVDETALRSLVDSSVRAAAQIDAASR
ncbi:MAG: DUF1801 domain-containing protein [Nocardioidaceae bacterium]